MVVVCYYTSLPTVKGLHRTHVSIGSTLIAAVATLCLFVLRGTFAPIIQFFRACLLPAPLSAPLSLSELNDSRWLAFCRWLRFGDGLASPDSSLSDTDESLVDFLLDLPEEEAAALPSLNASVNCFCLASHHICCLCTTSG